MMASLQYVATGTEANDGINTELFFVPGYPKLDVMWKGKSVSVTRNDVTGSVLIYGLLEKGDLITILYER